MNEKDLQDVKKLANDIPNVNSEEFDKFLKEHGFERKENTPIKNVYIGSDLNKNVKVVNSDETANIVEKFIVDHYGIILLLVSGVSIFTVYKLLQSFISGAVFKGNLKTIKYLEKFVR